MPTNPDNKKRKAEAVLVETDAGTAVANPPASEPPSITSAAASNNATGTPHETSKNKSRPKRARTKTEKKVEVVNTSRFYCDFCNRDLSLSLRVRCAVCPDYDSCLDCFSVGAALRPHKAEHAYRFAEPVHTPIFQAGWSADEEEKLIEGLESYGVGNWEQVAKVVRSKNPVETEQHFMKVFLESPNAPLPDPTKMLPIDKASLSDKNEDLDPKALRVMHMHQQEDAAGWMEKRQDFVYEWDNEAEDIIGDMEVAEEDPKADMDMKAQVLEIYAAKLDERARRKELVLDRGLTNFKGYQALEKKRPKDERDLRDKLRVFMRFVPQEYMNKFIRGVLEERKLCARLESLRQGRLHGARTVEECEKISATLKSKNRNSVGGSEAATPNATGSATQRRRRANGEGSVADSAGSTANGPTGVGVGASNSADSKDKKTVNSGDMDPELLPGAELLSKVELGLCQTLRITPHQYMIVKEIMIRESARLGGLRKKDAKAIVHLDSVKVFKIYDYLLACGWIKSMNNNANASRNSIVSKPTPNGTKV